MVFVGGVLWGCFFRPALSTLVPVNPTIPMFAMEMDALKLGGFLMGKPIVPAMCRA